MKQIEADLERRDQASQPYVRVDHVVGAEPGKPEPGAEISEDGEHRQPLDDGRFDCAARVHVPGGQIRGVHDPAGEAVDHPDRGEQPSKVVQTAAALRTLPVEDGADMLASDDQVAQPIVAVSEVCVGNQMRGAPVPQPL